MAKHSHWHNIRHKKAANDQKKAKVIAKMGTFIVVAVSHGGPNLDDNPRLRVAVDKARSAGMPLEVIERAIKKASGQAADGKIMHEVTYEGYAPGGIAVVVDCLTDNRNRTAPEVKKLFERAGGSIGAPGCVAWQFKARCTFIAHHTSEDAVMETLLGADVGVEDITALDDSDEDEVPQGRIAITADPHLFSAISRALTAAKIKVGEAGFAKLPENRVAADALTTETLTALLDSLEEHDDVQDVFHNGDWTT